MEILNGVNGVITIIALFSAMLNVIFYYRRSAERKALRTQMQTDYNAFFIIARACSRVKEIRRDNNFPSEDHLFDMQKEIGLIVGVTDSLRISIISSSRENLHYIPKYEHPAYPDRFDWPDDVRLGQAPEDSKQVSDL